MSARHYVYVDDDADNREVLRVLIEEVIGAGSLTLFADTHQLVEQLRTMQPLPDIIFLDIRVHPLDGYAIISEVRKDSLLQSCRVIAVTAGSIHETLARLKSSGFDGALSKPFDMVSFPQLIEQLEAGETIWQVR